MRRKNEGNRECVRAGSSGARMTLLVYRGMGVREAGRGESEARPDSTDERRPAGTGPTRLNALYLCPATRHCHLARLLPDLPPPIGARPTDWRGGGGARGSSPPPIHKGRLRRFDVRPEPRASTFCGKEKILFKRF
jgi:hypothetical protein